MEKLKTVSIEEMIDRHIGKLGTEKREAFERELRIDLLQYAVNKHDLNVIYLNSNSLNFVH